MNNYYVYVYSDPKNLVPFYVGMGKGKRYLSHLNEARKAARPSANLHKIRKIQSILDSGQLPIIRIIDENLDYTQAAELEIFLISFVGRRDTKTGSLTNLTDGGDGTFNVSSESKQKKQSTCIKKYGVSNFSHTLEFKENARLVKLKEISEGKHWPTVNRQLVSENTKRQVKEGRHPWTTDEYKQRMSTKCKENNAARNLARKTRPIVLELIELYAKSNLKQPRGGLWNKSDAWLEHELKNWKPFGEL